MQKHTKIYFDFFGVDYDPVTGWHDCVSEISGLPAVDIHHIISRGRGGDNSIMNLMAVTREEHIKYGDKPKYDDWLKEIHIKHIHNAIGEY